MKNNDTPAGYLMAEQEEKKAEGTTPEKVKDENSNNNSSNRRRSPGEIPPWKKQQNITKDQNTASAYKNNNDNNVDIMIASPSKSNSNPVDGDTKGSLRQESTYQGERGGDAHDEELLALLRGVSAKSGAADRFGEVDQEKEEGTNEPVQKPIVEEPVNNPKELPQSTKTADRKNQLEIRMSYHHGNVANLN